MERVAFLIEDTGARLDCLLNPESLVMRRRAGIRSRQSSGNLVTGANMMDDSLLYTGGGCTWLELDLLFDISLAGSSIVSDDVRDLTRPLWDLAENTRHNADSGQPAVCRLVWGKSWNFPGVVTAVAERLEYFSPDGTPRRSWLRMRLLRVIESAQKPNVTPSLSAPDFVQSLPSPAGLAQETLPSIAAAVQVHETIGSGPGEEDEGCTIGERLDQLAYQYLGDAGRWRELAIFNNIDDPMCIRSGLLLEIPVSGSTGAAP